MAGRQEDKRCGVSCEKDAPNVSVLPVKLTDTAPRALETSQDGKDQTSQLSVQFQGSQGLVQIPKVDVPNEVHTFNFNESNVATDDPQGSFECVQQIDSSSGALQLSCLGLIQNKTTVRATSDSCVTTRESTTQAEEESRSRTTEFIKPGGPFLVKKAAVKRAPEGIPDVVPRGKQTRPKNPALAIRRNRTNNPVSQRPYRDRVIHLLALRSYKKPELLARLQRDGVKQKDRDSLGIILQQVANLNTKDNTYSLKNYLFKDIQKDWPGYSERERELLELRLSTKLNSSDTATSASPKESLITSHKDSPSNSQKRLSDSSCISPPLNKKPRISRVQTSLSGWLPTSSEKVTATPLLPPPSTAATMPSPLLLTFTLLPTSNLLQTATSNSSSTPGGLGTQDLPMYSFNQNSNSISEDQQQKYTSQTPLGTPAPAVVTLEPPKPTGEEHAVSHQKPKDISEHKENKSKTQDTTSASEKEKDLRKEETAELKKSSHLDLGEGVKEACAASAEPTSSSEQPDYFIKYTTIVSHEQRQRYEDDFNAEYGEYRNLHARIESTVKRFTKLAERRKLISPGSKEYEILCKEVLEEYQKVKQSNPNYHEEKCRCEYLHKKLSHIKRLVEEFDQQQAKSCH
ncbi:RNA polymerase II elongation factor ELL2-like [Pterocles gutturalis]